MKCPALPVILTVLCTSLDMASADSIPSTATPSVVVGTTLEPVTPGKFEPTWESLSQYQVPDWFRDAKFGIWAHWGPQCQPEKGDWYARAMYLEGSGQYKSHLERYGHPSKAGFKDVINEWKAENWDPGKLVTLYKKAGAQYFFALANHHDNLDLWDSPYQPWNSMRVGPHKDLIAGWAKAARDNGLRFGVSIHAAHAWSWYEPAQGADKSGPLVGVPYDGKLTKADGKGTWWEGFDPQELYAQNHTPAENFQNPSSIHNRWDWGNGSSVPDQAYCEKFYNRTADLIKKYQPDLIYFDDTALPLWPVSDAGLKIAADFYNRNLQDHGGRLEGVIFGKILTDDQKRAVVWDVERGVPSMLLPYAWQTDTCIGNWHYDRGVYDRNGYKSTATVIHMLADIVSKNGHLLLNIPVRGDGTIDEKEEKIVEEIGDWMAVNKEGIFGTRPWKVFGEGPASDGAPINAQGFNEGKGKAFTADDVRFTASKDNRTIYAIVMGWPAKSLALKSLGKTAGFLDKTVEKIELLGSQDRIVWTQNAESLAIETTSAKPASAAAVSAVYKLTLR